MRKLFSVEELIINESFVNYCRSGNPEDIAHWENYILQHPLERETVNEAKSFIIGLKEMLKTAEKDKAVERFISSLDQRKIDPQDAAGAHQQLIPAVMKTGSIHKFWWPAAASVVILMAVAFWATTGKTHREVASNERPEKINREPNPLVLKENDVARTNAGEKKIVFLPDGTRVTMNVESVLFVDSNFGRNTRLVKLEGEAFFDVAHNPGSPFIVQLNDFNVRVLGTMFNVRSYAADKNSETALVKGKVEILLKNHSQKRLFLKPNEKIVLSNASDQAGLSAPEKNSSGASLSSSVEIKPLTIGDDGNSIIETGWMQNRLEINDETFIELKNKLERWYGVSLVFTDDDVKAYRFTATFEKENIDQALEALKLSYSFNYTKKNNHIMIGK